MSSPLVPGAAPTAPLRGELRYGLELARLLADAAFLRPARTQDAPPVLLVPGFMAGDSSLGVLAGWLRRRGSRVGRAGILLNTDCGEREAQRLEARVERLAGEAGKRVVLLGQSRGGELARVVAARNGDAISTLVMLGSPVLGPLEVGPSVLNAVRSVARLGDLGVPRMFSTACGSGPCCENYRADLERPVPDSVRAVSIYSRSDGIVSWQACLDPCAEHVEVQSSHTGMSVNVQVYRRLAQILDEEAGRWTG
ncbi:MAG TPA: alpha/beta hydrolase [Thermoleophilaceae bacterium]|jgi:pimeloyl-ACP methyl ester carboxylesterase|nr:alpha/beta hydrolase [Thermoleophilaceae bacterium]